MLLGQASSLMKGKLMSGNFEVELFICQGCGHRWILVSNIPISNKLRIAWLNKCEYQHKRIQNEKDQFGQNH